MTYFVRRELEDILREREERVSILERREKELRGMSEEMVEANSCLKRELEEMDDEQK